MLPIAYTISPYLIRYLEKIELLRRQIILAPLPQSRELSLQFTATIDRLHFGLLFVDQKLQAETIKTVLGNQIVFAMQKDPQSRSMIQTTILRYKQSLDYIKKDWLLNDQAITLQTLLHLYEMTAETKLPVPEKRLQEILTYLDSSEDNAFIRSAIAKLQIRNLLPINEENEHFSTLCSYLFLYKSGMDCRGLLVLEKAWMQEKPIFLGHYQTAISKPNITSWLEYYVKILSVHLEKTLEELSQTTSHKEQVDQAIGKLNERQKTIMTLLDDPKAVITNRTVQKIFHISQITASRDLAKLTTLGLLYTHGKGRSVRYTRI
jgi:hypothetical protein